MREAQRRDRGQRVKNVAHGAQADHEQAEVGLRVQSLIFAQRDQRSAGNRAAELAELAELAALENDCHRTGSGCCLPFSIYPPFPRYAIPPYLITKGLRDGPTLPIPCIPISRAASRKRADPRELRAFSRPCRTDCAGFSRAQRRKCGGDCPPQGRPGWTLMEPLCADRGKLSARKTVISD